MTIRRYILFLFILGFFSTVRSAEELSEIIQITTHPAVDFAPSVSPNGKWLAFTSDRSGNLDVWVKELPRGKTIRVTSHQAEDSYPVWSPDGEKLAFFSKRRDARGDIWMIRMDSRKSGEPVGDPIQVTSYLGVDRSPSFSPDGKQIVFSSDRDGQINLWVQELKTGRNKQLTFNGGTDPKWAPGSNWILFTSYRDDPNGDIYVITAESQKQPMAEETPVYPIIQSTSIEGKGNWTIDGKGIVFVRLNRDTNRDGKITPQDNGSLWQKTLASEELFAPDEKAFYTFPEIQITSGYYSDNFPCFNGTDLIVFSSSRNGGTDVWSIPAGGLPGRGQTAESQFFMAMTRFGEVTTPAALYQAVLGYRMVREYFPQDSAWVAKAMVQEAEILKVLEENEEARMILESVAQNYRVYRREVARAELKLATLSSLSVPERMELCKQAAENFTDIPSVAAEAWIILGDLYREIGENGQSFSAYGQVVRSYYDLRHWRAQAQLRIGDLLENEGQTETARQSYFAVLRDLNRVPLWRKRASDRLLAQIKGSVPEKIKAYQKIVQEASEFPDLKAEAQLRIGQSLTDDKQFTQAIREFEKVEEIVPEAVWAHAKSRILQAKAYGRIQDELRGVYLLEDVIQNYRTVEGGAYMFEAEDVLFDLLFTSAERLSVSGDYQLAASRYLKAMEIRPKEVRVHRGLIECMFQSGKINEVVREYEQKLKEHPTDPVYLYGLGLALSYQGERASEILKKSNQLLEASLAEDYRMIYPYRTLGFNYELLEKLSAAEKNKKYDFWGRTKRVATAPVRFLARMLPFQHRAKEAQYYEKAIEVLTAALELNNEKQDPQMEAMLSQNLANNFYHLGEFGYSKAYHYYHYRLELDTTFAYLLEKAVFYEQFGHCGIVAEEFEASDQYLKTAIRLYVELDREDDLLRTQHRLALLYHIAGRYEDAIDVYEKILESDLRYERWDEVERDYRNIAYQYHLLDEPEDVLKYAGKAEQLLLKQNIPIHPAKKSYLRVEILGLSIPVWGMEEIGGALSEGFTEADELALVYGLTGKSLETLKRFPEAIEYEKKRLDIFQKRKDRLAQRMTLNRLGLLSFCLNQFDEAWDYFYQSREYCKKQEDTKGLLINTLNLGNVAIANYEIRHDVTHAVEAKACLEEELNRLSSISGDRDRLYLNTALGNILVIQAKGQTESGKSLGVEIRETLLKVELLKQAEKYFQDAAEAARKSGMWREEGILYKNIAEACEMAGDNISAYNYLGKSDAILRKSGAEEYLWRIQYSRARLAEKVKILSADKMQELPDPVDLYMQSMEQLEALPIEEEASEEFLSDRSDRWNLYTDAAKALVNRGQFKKGLETIERGRQKFEADLIARHPPVLKRERHKVLWGNLRFIRSRLGELNQKIIEEESNKNRETLILEWKNTRIKYLDEYHALLDEIQEEDGVLAYLTGVLPVDVGTVQSHLKAGKCVLNYLICEDRTLLWTMDRDRLQFTFLPINGDSLVADVDRFLQCIKKDSAVDVVGERLYRMLVRPVEPFIEDKTEILIVPDGILWQLPFAALPGGDGRLSDLYTFHYAPSLLTYRLARERRKINQADGLLIGTRMDEAFSGLMEKAMQKSTLLLGNPTEEEVDRAALSADIVQLERWMVANEDNPLEAAVVLFPDPGHDGFIKSGELFSWDMRASAVLFPFTMGKTNHHWLSQQTFVQGLLYAGVPSVIMMRWPVDREIKVQFLKTFYQNIQEMPLIEALAEAQIAVRKTCPDIYSWGAFQLIGFEGMGPADRMAFARDRLVATVIKGRAYENAKEYPEAIRSFENGLDMARAVDDPVSIQRIQSEIIRVCIKGAMWDKAIAYQKQEIENPEVLADQESVIKKKRNLVSFYFRNGQVNEAVAVQKEIIQIVRSAEMDEQQLGALYEQLAFMYASDQNYTQAIQWADTAFQYYIRAGDDLSQGRAYIIKGRFFLESEEYWQARTFLNLGISVIDSFLVSVPDNEKALFEKASGCQLLGIALERIGQYTEAIRLQEDGISIFTQLNQPTQIAQGHQYLANLYWKTGNYREALTFQRAALEDFGKLGNSQLLLMGKATMGLIYMSLGDLKKAKITEQEAFDLAVSNMRQIDQATILKNMGMIAVQEGNDSYAYGLFRQATQIDSVLKYQSGLAYDFKNMGMLLSRMNRLDESIATLQKSITIARQLGDRSSSVSGYYGLGMAYAKRGEYSQAKSVLDKGLEESQNLVIPDLSWRLYRQRALVLASMGKQRESLTDFKNAIEIVENMRAELRVEQLKQGFFDDKKDLYVDLIQYLSKINQPEEAFHYAERAKSRNFVDLLGNQELKTGHFGSNFLKRENEAKLSIREAQLRLSVLLQQDNPLKTIQDEKVYWENQLSERRKTYEELIVQMQIENPELASLVSVDPWDVGKIQKLLPDSTALIEYFVTPKSLFCWFVRSGEVILKQVEIDETKLLDLIKQYRQTIQANLSADREAHELYHWLIEPVEDKLRSVHHLVIVPHAGLHYLPFAALQNPAGRYLVGDYSISLVPSATVLGYCMEKRKSMPDEPSVLAMSNPDLGDPRFDLIFAEKEVQTLKRTYDRVDAYFGSDVTESKVRQTAGLHDILHFACHATYESESPLFSALLLTPSGNDDGRLEVQEIFNLDLNCDLVTLSACETGLGKVTEGDEIIGLARVFIFAGTPSIITSLWKVDDLATAVLMKRFYRYLEQGFSKADALRMAQIHVKNVVQGHPAAWAAFTLTGDFR